MHLRLRGNACIILKPPQTFSSRVSGLLLQVLVEGPSWDGNSWASTGRAPSCSLGGCAAPSAGRRAPCLGARPPGWPAPGRAGTEGGLHTVGEPAEAAESTPWVWILPLVVLGDQRAGISQGQRSSCVPKEGGCPEEVAEYSGHPCGKKSRGRHLQNLTLRFLKV